MESMKQIIFMAVLALAVAGYSVYNYLNGRTGLDMLIASLAILALPLINMISILIRNRKNKD